MPKLKQNPAQKKITANQINNIKGRLAEYIASLFLQTKGYTILHNRFKTKFGEIDIIAKKDDLIVFVEVKNRTNLFSGAESITPASIERISNAAQLWFAEHIEKNPEYTKFSQRLDAIIIHNKITHFENMHTHF